MKPRDMSTMLLGMHRWMELHLGVQSDWCVGRTMSQSRSSRCSNCGSKANARRRQLGELELRWAFTALLEARSG
jgi:hypothetical protein